MGWFTTTSKPTCHFCQSQLVLISPDLKGKAKLPDRPYGWDNSPNAFLCGVCDSWNTTDQDGRLTSAPPRWINPNLDWKPFDQSVVAPPRTSTSGLSPSHSTTFASTAPAPFCRTCLSNQSLQTHLLASFPIHLPDDPDPDPPSPPLSPELTLDDYRHRLDQRYPLLCANCAPGVEEAIKKHDYKAKAWALGHRLTKSSVRGLTGVGAGGGEPGREGEWRWWVAGVVWRLRGAGWWATQVGAVLVCALAVAQPSRFTWSHSLRHSTSSLHRFALPLTLTSILWSFWDPTWFRARRERARGRRLDVHGRGTFLALQAFAYCLRLALVLAARMVGTEDVAFVRKVAAASMALFVVISIISLRTIKLRPPPRVRLTSTRKPTPSFPTPPAPEEVLESLSLSPSPAPTSALSAPASTLRMRTKQRSPVFGAFAPSSLSTPTRAMQPAAAAEEVPLVPDSMEWEPLEAPVASGGGVQLAKPRFWPEGWARGTGLEERMGSGMILDDAASGEERMDEDVKEAAQGGQGSGGGGGWRRWGQ